AAGRAVADGLVVGECAPVAGQGAWVLAHRAKLAAVRAGLLGGEGLGLLLQEGGEWAFGESAGGGLGNLLQGEQIDVQPRSGVAEGTAGDNLAPLGGQIADVLEFFGCQWRSAHGLPCLGLAPSDVSGRSGPFYRKARRQAKPVLASTETGASGLR